MKKTRSKASEQNTQNNRTVNWWKWAFITLVAFIIVSFSILLISAQPKTINEPNLDPTEQRENQMVLETTLNKKEVENFINLYFASLNEEDVTNIQLTDQLEINGGIDIFGFDVPYELSFDPYVMENGNLQLRADSLELASFSLPVSAVMSLLAEQLEIPDFIAFNSDEQMIVINFNEFEEDTKFGIEMTKIDLENDVIDLKLHLNNQDLINQMILELD